MEIGFKEIEVGFPAASDTEYQFLRTLIEQDLIPDDVTIQVLTQAREHIIRKTFEALKGAPSMRSCMYTIPHLCAQREQVFQKSKEEIKKIAVDGATASEEAWQMKKAASYRLSTARRALPEPRSIMPWKSAMQCWTYGSRHADRKAIINLPSTVADVHAARLCKPDRVYERASEIP